MTTVTGLEQVTPTPSVVTIGNFDGVHRGHRVLLRRAVDTALEADVRSVAITFEPHPAAIVRPGSEPPRLQTLDDRIASLHATGVDLVVVLPFTPALAALAPERFIQQVLAERLQASRVVVGTNFRFGNRAAGDVVTLVEAGEEHGFVTEAVTLLDLDGHPISSSSIRARLGEGNVQWAAQALGRPHRVVGEVVRGDGRGRTIGIPTANLDVLPGLLVPGNGVYAGHLHLGELILPAITNVGVRPTFDGEHRTVETHVLDAAGQPLDLYGARVAVSFTHRIRGEQRFDGPDALVAQIHADIEVARSALASS